MSPIDPAPYRGRLAPSPTGYLHLGHARTFWVAQQRAESAGGRLIFRNDDLDRARCRPEFVTAMYADLRWFGCDWQEGPDCGGPFGPYSQSERFPRYREALARLQASGLVYPCTCSRQDVLRALGAPQAGEDEPLYPGTCRPAAIGAPSEAPPRSTTAGAAPSDPPRTADRAPPAACNWRFRVPDGQVVAFVDGARGAQRFVAGIDFGDFVVWRHDDVPAYQLACVVDDDAMQITEVVRGADLLRSTARQLLLYHALFRPPPRFYHGALVTDARGVRLAKRHDALSLRALRAQGRTPESLRQDWVG